MNGQLGAYPNVVELNASRGSDPLAGAQVQVSLSAYEH